MKNEKRFCIGIDPGAKTGLAIYDRKEGVLTEVSTTSFWPAISTIEIRFRPELVHVVAIEIPNTTHVWHKGAKNRGAIEKTALNVGKAIREAELMRDWLTDHGYDLNIIHPKGKIKQDKFERMTGYKRNTSQHGRDAGMLCWGL